MDAEPEMVRFHTVKVLRTDLRIGERVVSFYNTHIHAPRGAGAAPADTKAAEPRPMSCGWRGLRALAADVESNPQPAFVAGDFNTTPAMGALRGLPERLVDAGPALGSALPDVVGTAAALVADRLGVHHAEVVVHRYRMVPPQTWSDHSGQEVVISLR